MHTVAPTDPQIIVSGDPALLSDDALDALAAMLLDYADRRLAVELADDKGGATDTA